MSATSQCGACAAGQHERHVRVIVAALRGGVGGVICGCHSECERHDQFAEIAALLFPADEAAHQ